jgi:hypothetical protein
VKLCVPNGKVGLPDKFLTVAEAFNLIAENLKGMMEKERP